MSATRQTVRIRSSSNVALGYDVAGIGSRMLAQLLDWLILAVIIIVLVVGVEYIGATLDPSANGVTFGLLIAIASSVLGVIAYFTIAEGFTSGRTPGKRALGLRVIRTDGSAAGFTEALIRSTMRIADNLLFLGPVVMFINPQSRRFGDLAAGTLVIRERTGVARAGYAQPPPALVHTLEAGPPVQGITLLGKHELSVLRQFLSRYDLDPQQRRRLAATMAVTLCDRMRLAPTAVERGWPAEFLLETLFLQLDQRARVGL